MALYQNYPYTDMQTLNLDGVLRQVKTNKENIESTAQDLAQEGTERKAADADLLQLIRQIDPTIVADKSPYTPQMFGAKADGVTDDTRSIQDCIDAAHADGRAVYFPGGVYAVGTVLHDIGTGRDCALKCYDGDALFGDGTAVLLRTSTAVQRMLHTYGASDAGAYNAIHRLNIYGLNFNNNRDLDTQQNTIIFMACHGENVHVRNCSFTGCNGWHCIELNSLRFSSVENCYFTNSENTATGTCEHIQIDAALSGTGVWGLEDGTVCHDIKISGNMHRCGTGVGVGNHTNAAHYGIIVSDCIFSDYTGIRGAVTFVDQMKESAVIGCRFSNCTTGVNSGNQTVSVFNSQFVNVNVPVNGVLNAYNCIADGCFISMRNSSYGNENANVADIMAELMPFQTEERIAAFYQDLPVNDSGKLFTGKLSNTGNYGLQQFSSNSGLFYRLFNRGAFGGWQKTIASAVSASADVNAEFDALSIGDLSIKYGNGDTQNRPAGAGAGLCVTVRNMGSGNYGTQFYLSNDGIFARKYANTWGSWKTINTLA